MVTPTNQPSVMPGFSLAVILQTPPSHHLPLQLPSLIQYSHSSIHSVSSFHPYQPPIIPSFHPFLPHHPPSPFVSLLLTFNNLLSYLLSLLLAPFNHIIHHPLCYFSSPLPTSYPSSRNLFSPHSTSSPSSIHSVSSPHAHP